MGDRAMIETKTILEVQRLLQEGSLSHRKIAVQTGISRGTVNAIAKDNRRCYRRMWEPKKDEDDRPVLPPSRCSNCGGTVHKPCLLCETRRRIAEGKQTPRRKAGEVFEPLGLNLRPEHRARYEQVCARRKELAESPDAAPLNEAQP
jgi:hypothetical protein